ncbi:MAG: hypothetical protein HGGPFJEG_02200 [Ignavibacteria bacterium]|nr:hypothetical protein [Ignavibacteria bacterium]
MNNKIKIFIIFFILTASFQLNAVAGLSPVTSIKEQSQDTNKKLSADDSAVNEESNQLMIDTSSVTKPAETIIPVDTSSKLDSALIEKSDENVMTNTKLFVYILLSVLGMGLFFFIFIINLFKTFHKKRSTRQSLLLCWSLFFVVSVIWIFIVWGLFAGFWTASSFMIIMIFLFIISLIMTIIAIKSK